MAKPLSGITLLLSTIALSMATFLIVLDYSIANVSIPYISGDLAVSVDQGTYVITSFAVGNSIVLPITGWLTKRLGIVKLMILSLLLFILFSWICGIAWNLPILVISRFIQGAVAGPMIPLSQSLIMMIYPSEKKNFATAIWSTVVMVAPIVGPILGGWISYDFSWPWIFFINIPIGLISVLMIKFLLKGNETPKEKPPVDYIGFILLAIGVSALQIVLDKGQQFDWLRSPIILTLSITSFIAFTYLIAWEATHPTPLLELKLFKIRSYALSVVFMAVFYALYFGSVILIPLWLQTQMNYTPIWAGIAVAPIGLAPILFAKYIAKLIGKVGFIIPLGISFILFSLSCFLTSYFNTDVDLFHVSFSRLILGVGILFLITPLFGLSMQDLTMEKMPMGSGMFHFVRAMSGAIGTSLFTTLWIRRSIFHHSNLAAFTFPENPALKEMVHSLNRVPIEGKASFAAIDQIINQQASVLAINDCFFLMGWIFIGLLFILILGRKKKTHSLSLLSESSSTNPS
ncbi:MAG: DHA2 family efflux MFS transporter permease subunit [Chlamydiae bacterium]|nr:DHA2 family efflux MFS transporter permease subunit [Chlamydiota bacterium]